MRPPLALDSVSPQTPLVAAGCAWLVERIRPGGGELADVVAAARALADAQPAMAALLSLGTRAVLVARKAEREEAGPAERVARIEEAIDAWRTDFARAGEDVVARAAETLPASGWVATTTRSSLVERALLAAHRSGRSIHVLCAESRPMNEGGQLAAALAEAGVPVWFAVDGALALLLPQAGAVWLGADAVRERTFVAKAGTYALLLVARELTLPAYVLAQRVKFVPDRCRRLTLPRRDPAEVWAEAPRGVNVVNLPFEEVPLALVRGVVTEGGFLGPREVEDAAGSAAVAPELLDAAPPVGRPAGGR
jgi:translation initiation factor 2B subunit (eIF-2B alpha/beta/delta family)